MDIPLNYIIDNIYQNCKRVKNKNNGVFIFECPVCREGKSSGKKRRGYFFSNHNYFYCQNCQRSWNPINWIKETRHISFKEIMNEIDGCDYDSVTVHVDIESEKNKKDIPSLPDDCINLSDKNQVNFYKDNKIIQLALSYISNRRLDTAINKPKTFYISLTDYTYKNRLCIPFYNENDDIIYYQARALTKEDEDTAKYFSKKEEKSIYGMNNIDSKLDYVFIFEGPIDSMFCKNGIGMCGLTPTPKQLEQLDKFRTYKKIWVLDNQPGNKEVQEKYLDIINRDETIFSWPSMLCKFKDVNEVCVHTKRDFISPDFFIKNSYKGIQAEMRLIKNIF